MSVIVHSHLEQPRWQVPRLQFRPVVALWGLVAILLCASLCFGGQKLLGTYQDQIAVAAPAQVAAAHTTTLEMTPVKTTASAPQPAAGGSTHATTPIQTCVPYSGNMTPSSLNLTTAPAGLTKQIDAPTPYRIYGNTANTLRSQVKQCAPKTTGDAAEFTAETTYQLTWQYDYINNGGTCTVTNAKVGIHVMQVVPLWQPTTAAQAGLASQWQTFMNNLMTHENGHLALDVQYAQTLLDDLNHFPPTPCDQLAQSIKYVTDHDVATLNQANDNYDATTDHGATQGAILP